MRTLTLAIVLCSVSQAWAQPKTIEIQYSKDGKMVGTTVKRAAGHSRSIRDVGVGDIPRLVGQNAPALVVLYTSTCGACRKLLPRLARLDRKWGRRGFSVLAFSLDADRPTLRRYVKGFRGDLRWLRIRPYRRGQLKKTMHRMGVSVVGDVLRIPVYAVFDGKRKLVAEGIGAAAYSKLGRFAAQLAKSR